MPDHDRRANPYPFPTAAEALAAPGTREEKAARNVISRHVHGIPKRAFILGEADHAPVMHGIRDLVTAVYALLDDLAEDSNSHPAAFPIIEILEHHGCPEALEPE